MFQARSPHKLNHKKRAKTAILNDTVFARMLGTVRVPHKPNRSIDLVYAQPYASPSRNPSQNQSQNKARQLCHRRSRQPHLSGNREIETWSTVQPFQPLEPCTTCPSPNPPPPSQVGDEQVSNRFRVPEALEAICLKVVLNCYKRLLMRERQANKIHLFLPDTLFFPTTTIGR